MCACAESNHIRSTNVSVQWEEMRRGHNVSESPLSVREAMDAVLAAEREAQDALVEAQSEANAILADAHQQARRIQERGEQRIARMQESVNRALAARIREMRKSASRKSESFEYDPSRSAAIERAAAELARRLTNVE